MKMYTLDLKTKNFPISGPTLLHGKAKDVLQVMKIEKFEANSSWLVG